MNSDNNLRRTILYVAGAISGLTIIGIFAVSIFKPDATGSLITLMTQATIFIAGITAILITIGSQNKDVKNVKERLEEVVDTVTQVRKDVNTASTPTQQNNDEPTRRSLRESRGE